MAKVSLAVDMAKAEATPASDDDTLFAPLARHVPVGRVKVRHLFREFHFFGRCEKTFGVASLHGFYGRGALGTSTSGQHK